MKMPKSIGLVHFIGIGGIGMSGIAEVMATLGYKVQGSDLTDNYNVARLRKNGIDVHVGHKAENLGEALGRIGFPVLQRRRRRLLKLALLRAE